MHARRPSELQGRDANHDRKQIPALHRDWHRKSFRAKRKTRSRRACFIPFEPWFYPMAPGGGIAAGGSGVPGESWDKTPQPERRRTRLHARRPPVKSLARIEPGRYATFFARVPILHSSDEKPRAIRVPYIASPTKHYTFCRHPRPTYY